MEVMKDQTLPRSLKGLECQVEECGLYLVGNGGHERFQGREQQGPAVSTTLQTWLRSRLLCEAFSTFSAHHTSVLFILIRNHSALFPNVPLT